MKLSAFLQWKNSYPLVDNGPWLDTTGYEWLFVDSPCMHVQKGCWWTCTSWTLWSFLTFLFHSQSHFSCYVVRSLFSLCFKIQIYFSAMYLSCVANLRTFHNRQVRLLTKMCCLARCNTRLLLNFTTNLSDLSWWLMFLQQLPWTAAGLYNVNAHIDLYIEVWFSFKQTTLRKHQSAGNQGYLIVHH